MKRRGIAAALALAALFTLSACNHGSSGNSSPTPTTATDPLGIKNGFGHVNGSLGP
jgi:hypothetical protein